MGVTDSGQWFSRAFAGGVLGGLVAGLWSALYAAMSGVPWWSPLAMYRTSMFGLSPHPIVSAGLTGAVVAGCAWLMIGGLMAGALFGLLGGSLLPRTHARGVAGFGLVFGLILYALTVWGVPLLPAATTAHLAGWGRLLALVLMGGTIGRVAGSTA